MKGLIVLGMTIVCCIVWLIVIFLLAKKEDRKTFIEMLKDYGKKLKPLLKEIKKNEKR